MGRPKYELIFLDSDDTIFDYKKCEKKAMYLTLEELLKSDHKTYLLIYKCYMEINLSLWKLYHAGEITKEYLLTERFQRLIDRFKLPVKPQKFSETYLYNLSNQNFLIKNSEEVIKKLSKKCTLAIITNGVSTVHHMRLARSILKPYISALIVSGDYPQNPNFQKPLPAIFEYAHLKIKPFVPKEKLIMVGDSLNSDVAGGINYGINTCWLNESKVINDSKYLPTYEISNLKELLEILL